MTRDEIKNLPASVRQRLTNLADHSGEPFQRVLVNYGLERLLYRLSRSRHHDRFVLKGALLFAVWSDLPHRPTVDVDLMSTTTIATAELVSIFKAICATKVDDDGLAFPPGSVRGEEIRETRAYAGVRLKLLAKLGNARVDLQVDIGFADAITPGPMLLEYPSLLGFPAAQLSAYPRETVVAEKLEAAVSLGMQNTRMKDFYDLWVMARNFDFDGEVLSSAIRNTFDRRRTELPARRPVALPDEFVADRTKKMQWAGFLAKSGLPHAILSEAAVSIEMFLAPPTLAAAKGRVFRGKWPPMGPWREKK